jgi:uncharacterized membrane protein HdeD (DUF308 family)
MRRADPAGARVGQALILVSVVLLVGVLLLGRGWLAHDRTALYVGLMLILAGVLVAVPQLVRRGGRGARQRRRRGV